MNCWSELEDQTEDSDTDGEKMFTGAQGTAQKTEKACVDHFRWIRRLGASSFWRCARKQEPQSP